MKSTTLNIRIEPDIKEQAEAVFRQLGLSSTTAINLFFRQVILHGGIPFALKTQPKQTMDSQSVLKQPEKEVPPQKVTNKATKHPYRRPTANLSTSLVPPDNRIIPAFTTFDDDASRAEAWQKQHDNEGI
ncbi:MAG: type II toxin-antitoxin system RelB/DinJ family antitoxin [Oxalobacter sp.]